MPQTAEIEVEIENNCASNQNKTIPETRLDVAFALIVGLPVWGAAKALWEVFREG